MIWLFRLYYRMKLWLGAKVVEPIKRMLNRAESLESIRSSKR